MFSLLFYYSCSIPMIGISFSGTFFVFHSSIWWTLVQCWSSEHKIHLSIKCWKIQGYTIQQQPPYTKSWYSIAWFCNGFFADAKLFHIFSRGILITTTINFSIFYSVQVQYINLTCLFRQLLHKFTYSQRKNNFFFQMGVFFYFYYST